jgi:hypothetical protein
MGCGANAPSPSGDSPRRSKSGDETLPSRFTFTGDGALLPPGEAAAAPPPLLTEKSGAAVLTDRRGSALFTDESGTPHSRRALRTGWWSQRGVGQPVERAPASQKEEAVA